MLINGVVTNEICAADRGLAYADGLFSTIRIEFGIVQDWSYHLARLQRGAKRLFFPEVDWLLLTDEVVTAAESQKIKNYSVLKIMLTRGTGGRGYSPDGCCLTTRIISLSHYPESYLQWQQHGIAIVQCECLLGRNKQLAGLKTLARIEQVLIKQELYQKQALEGLVCDEFGHVIEACSANVFIHINGHWVTPKLDYCGVAGVIRARLLDQCLINIVEREISVDEIHQAQAMCLSNALMGVVAVKQYQNIIYSEQQMSLVKPLQEIINQGSGQ